MRTLSLTNRIAMALLTAIMFMSASSNTQAGNYPNLDQPATFGTTQTDLKAYLAESLEYPKSLVLEGYEVKVHVKFWVDKFGHVLNAEIASTEVIGNGIGQITEVEMSLFEAEALRAINGMPKWTPAVVDGEATPVQFIIPILFKTA